MKIKVETTDASEEDCIRNDYFTVVDGKEYMLAPSALGSYWTWLEIKEKAEKLFGADVEIVGDTPPRTKSEFSGLPQGRS